MDGGSSRLTAFSNTVLTVSGRYVTCTPTGSDEVLPLTPKHANDTRKSRNGTCHRCGWRGQVAKLNRRERRALPDDRNFTRLCDDCLNQLLHARPGETPVAKSTRLRSVNNRDVA